MALTQWRAVLQNSNLSAPKKTQQARHVLRSRIWQEIETRLQGRKQVVIFADGDLHYLPWAALPGKQPGSYLVEEYAISTAQSGPQLYGVLTDQRPQQGGLLLTGGVDYDKRQADAPQPTTQAAAQPYRATSRSPVGKKSGVVWPKLPGSLKEMKAVQSLWKGALKPRLLQGGQADEDRLRQYLPSGRYIHLATHGFFADEKYRSMFGHNPQDEQLFGGAGSLVTARRASATIRNPLILSGIVLAGANLPQATDDTGLPIGQDGIFTAEEVVNLNLRNTELVVLSACETGLGRVGGGEGVYSLQRAFRLAGARSVIASLWKVDDDATRLLMTEFYRNLWHKKLGKLESLRQAQLAMLYFYQPKDGTLRAPVGVGKIPKIDPAKIRRDQSRNSPRYWAAFVLSGDWR